MLFQNEFNCQQTGEFLAQSLVRGKVRLVLGPSGVVEHVTVTVIPVLLRLHDAPEVLQALIRDMASRQAGRGAAKLGCEDLKPVFASLPLNQRIQVLDTSQSTTQRSITIMVDGANVLTLDNTVGWAEMAANWNGAYTKFDPKAWIPAVHELAVGAVEAHGFDIDWTDSNLVGRIYQAGLSSAAIDLHEEEGAAEAPASAPT